MPNRIHSAISPNGSRGWYWEVHVVSGGEHRVIARGIAESHAQARIEVRTAEAGAAQKYDPEIKRAG